MVKHEHHHISELLDKDKVTKQLNRIRGQVEGIIKLIEKDTYCIDVINQCKAIKGGLSKVEESVLEAHLKACVVKAVKENDEEDVFEDILKIYRASTSR